MANVTHRSPVSYIDKSREYYAAHGYEHPYRWASNRDAPLTTLARPLREARVGVVTTTFPVGFAPPKRVYAEPSTPTPMAMFTKDLSWDKEATTTDDVGSFLPLDHLRAMADEGRIGSLSPRFYGLPTEYSQRRTGEDAAAIEAMVKEDDVDVVLLVPL